MAWLLTIEKCKKGLQLSISWFKKFKFDIRVCAESSFEKNGSGSGRLLIQTVIHKNSCIAIQKLFINSAYKFYIQNSFLKLNIIIF